MSYQRWTAASLLCTFALTGCIEREGRPVSPCTETILVQTLEVTSVDQVDLLFMVDNSNSMSEEQASLAAEFPRMVEILASGDFELDGNLDGPDDFEPVGSLNVGVITSDMGTGGFTVPTCAASDFGDDGILRTSGNTATGCAATYPSFLNFEPGDGGDPGAFATDVACVATVGTGGCGFEQQLEAILKALSPSAPTAWTSDDFRAPSFFHGTSGHGDGVNAGFVRDRSVLAIIPVTDEEDCSAVDPELFNPGSATYGATDLNLRCFLHADQALHPIARFVDGFASLRENPAHLIYAPITGIPLDLAPAAGESPDWEALETDTRTQQREDPSSPGRLVPSCSVPGRGEAFPPPRIVRVGRRLEEAGAGVTVQSICQESFRPALREIIRQIKRALPTGCLPRRLGVETDGTVSCEVLATMPGLLDCSLGSTPLLADGVPVVEDGHNVCLVEQLVATTEERIAAIEPAGYGWFYDDYTSEGAERCGTGADTPFGRIEFTIPPPSGSLLRMECLQSVLGAASGQVGLGTLCDPVDGSVPDSTLTCGGDGLAPDGTTPLSCDPHERTCGLTCTSNADCRSTGLVGFVCDTRALSEVAPDEFAGDSRPYGFCVNPTCG